MDRSLACTSLLKHCPECSVNQVAQPAYLYMPFHHIARQITLNGRVEVESAFTR